jgi:PTS system nitrogen regulatory IIA component
VERRCRRAPNSVDHSPKTMNQIAQLLPKANIALNLEATSKKRLFEQIGQLFETQSQIARSVVFDSLFARERLGSTGLGQGIAIPHGRIKGLKEAMAAFVRPQQPIPFDAPDGKPVEQVFVLLVPEQATEEHLQLLSELAQMFGERSFREQVAHAADATEVHQVFADWQPEPQ